MPDLTRRACLGAVATAALPRAAVADTELVEAGALQADAELLTRTYTELHPGRLRHQSAGEAQARFAALRRCFNRQITCAEAYLAFSRATAAVRCGQLPQSR